VRRRLADQGADRSDGSSIFVEPMTGIEPAYSAWEAARDDLGMCVSVALVVNSPDVDAVQY
jgi:hypothetical protein